MKLPPLTAVIEKDEDWYVATCPELGVVSQGQTIEEAEAMIKEAVELLLEEASPEEVKRRIEGVSRSAGRILNDDRSTPR